MSDANGNVLSEDYLRGLSEGCTGEERYRLCDAADEMTRLRSELAKKEHELVAVRRQLSTQLDANDALASVIEEKSVLVASARAQTEAMRTLFAWAEKHEEATMPVPVFHRYMSKVDGGYCKQWRVALPFIGRGNGSLIGLAAFATAEEAIIATAEALVKDDKLLALRAGVKAE